MIVAAYRILYGHEFLAPSLLSVAGHVDAIYISWREIPWQAARGVVNWGAAILDAAKAANQRARSVVTAMASTLPIRELPLSVTSRSDTDIPLMVSSIHANCPAVDKVLFVEPDEVWRDKPLMRALDLAQSGCNVLVRRRDYWRSINHWIDPPNPHWSLKAVGVSDGRIPQRCAFDGAELRAKRILLPSPLAHFAYAQSPLTVQLKHAVCQWLESTPQHADWYDRVWLPWTWERGPWKNLCPVMGREDALAEVTRADLGELPEVMR